MDAETARRKACAERNALLSLAGILTHDLSNPLQSLTVLCELGLDDDDPAEAPRRAVQCLESTERMRALLHSYASVVRNIGRKGLVSASLDRMLPMFNRRLERHRIVIESHIELDFSGPGCVEFALVSMFLALMEVVGTGGRDPCIARIVTRDPDVILQLNRGGAPVTWPGSSLENTNAILGVEGVASADESSLIIRFEGAGQ